MSETSSTITPVNFTCLKCGCTDVAVSNGYEDDSITSCCGCGEVFGPWANVKAKAVELAKADLVASFKTRMTQAGWKVN